MSMRFLLIAGFPDSVWAFRGPFIEALQDCGLEVHLAAPDLADGTNLRASLEAKGLFVHSIPLLRTGTNPWVDLKTLGALWLLMRRIRPAYAMGYTVKPVIYGSIAGWLAGVQQRFALITGLGYAFQGEGQRGALRHLVQSLYAIALKRTKKVFFQNPDDEALFRSRGLLKVDLPSVVLNGSGVDVATFDVVPLPAQPVFLLIARLLGDKGVREYAEAARAIRALRPDAKFLLVGWIDHNPDAIRQAELDEWIRDEAVVFLGRMADVRPAIAQASVYVLPSYREGTPRTVLEAMAMGRAIITTDAPGCRETVVDGLNGLLVPVGEVPPLVAAMRRFLDNPAMSASMGLESRKLAVAKFDVRRVNSVMLKEMEIRC